jgi:hypothetical protein
MSLHGALFGPHAMFDFGPESAGLVRADTVIE